MKLVVPKMKQVVAPSLVDAVHLKYPEGTNFNEEMFCYAITTGGDTPDDFSVTIYQIGYAAKGKTFFFRDISRLDRVMRHFDSLTTEQIKDFLKEKK